MISQTGGANLQGGGTNLLFCQIFPENYMKMKEFEPGGGRGTHIPDGHLRSANGITDGEMNTCSTFL